MSQKIVQMDAFPDLEKKKPKSREEILESQVKLQFHEIKMCQELCLHHHGEIKALKEVVDALYQRKTF